MSTATMNGNALAKALASMLGAVPDVRIYSYVADASRVPFIVVGQPTADFQDAEAGFCRATWEFPVTVVTARNTDAASQAALLNAVDATVDALAAEPPSGVFSVDPLDARPITASVGGQDLPAYQLRVRVRA
jgi:ABC-type sugar transport system substrate-binding protein